MMKRVLLFLLTNILVVTTLSIVSSVLGLQGYLSPYGIDYQALAGICLVWGMGGSIMSLWMSRWVAKMAMHIQLIVPETAKREERELLDKVYSLARKAGLNTMPEVGTYQSPDLNAFATGPTRNRALVAVSTGLLEKMSADEIEGVLAHEISHVTNGDMVTMTLIQGVVNAFSMFLSRAIAYALSAALNRNTASGDNSNHRGVRSSYYVLTIVFDILFTLLGSLVVASFSRYREYRADKGGVTLAGRRKMIAALERLRLVTISNSEAKKGAFLEPLKISRQKNRRVSVFSTHPDIDLRIEALRR